MKKFLLPLTNIVISFVSYFFLIKFCGIEFNSVFTTSILSIALLYFIYKGLDYTYKNYEKKKFVFSIPIGILFALSLILGHNLYNFDSSLLDKLSTYIYTIGCCPAFIGIHYIIIDLFDKIRNRKNTKKCKIYDCIFNKGLKSYIIIFLLFFISWFIVFLAFYPGIFSYDSSVQLNEYFNGIGALSNANPILHTLLVGKTITLGNSLFHNYNVGVVIYTILQMIIVDLIYSYFIIFLNKNCKIKALVVITFVLLALLPTHSIFVLITSKDVLYSAFTLLLLIQLYKMVKFNEKFFKSKLEIILTIVMFFLTFITRHNGYYAFLVFAVFTLIGLRKYWKQLLFIILICFAGNKLFLNRVNDVLKLNETISFPTPLLCLPMQQIARTFNYSDNLTPQEIETWEYLTTKEGTYYTYTRTKSDAITWFIEPIRINNDKPKYIKSYIKIFLKNKLIFTDAFLFQTVGYWYVADPLPDQTTYRPYFELRARDDFDNTRSEIKFEPKLNKLFNLYFDLAENGKYQEVSILSILMNLSIYFWILLICVNYILYKKEFNKFIPISILFGLIVTLLLGPVSLVRYAYPIILSSTLIISLVLDNKFELKENHYFSKNLIKNFNHKK